MIYAMWAQTTIFAVTAVLVWWYTKETGKLRREMVRQNEIHLRPVVVPIFEEAPNQHVFKLQNVGACCALNVRVQPIKHMFGQSTSHQIPHETIFNPLDWLASGQAVEVRFTEFSNGKQVDYKFLQNKFFPAHVTSPVTITIVFDDVEGGRYERKISIEPSTHVFEAPALQIATDVKNVTLKGTRRLK